MCNESMSLMLLNGTNNKFDSKYLKIIEKSGTLVLAYLHNFIAEKIFCVESVAAKWTL